MNDFTAAYRKALADLHRTQRNKRGKRRPQAASGYRVAPLKPAEPEQEEEARDD